jgi:hypothetical protein
MQKLFSTALLILAAIQISFSQKNTSNERIFDISEAIRQKIVRVKIEGLGGHTGESLRVICHNLRGQYFRLRIPQGQLMLPADSTQQTLVVADEMLLSVTAKTPAEASLHTFCTQAGEASPSVGATFAIGALAPPQVCELLKFIAEKDKKEDSAAQNAVWCLTNGKPLGSIGDAELTAFVAKQLGKEAPGYRIRYSKVEEVPGQRAELGKALVIEGNFRYYLARDERVLMVLLDGQGKQIKQISKEETMKAGEHRSSLRLEIFHLPPGKYTLRMQTKAGRVIKDTEVEF